MSEHSEVITSVADAIRIFGKWENSPERFLAFRGQSNIKWDLKPHIMRKDLGLEIHESEMVREIEARYPGEFKDDVTMFDKLVRMQHFALPTRLLDVTVNPLVALFFATEDTAESRGGDGAVIVFSGPVETRRKYFDSDAVSCLANLANLTGPERSSIESSVANTMADFNKLKAVDRLLQAIRTEKPWFRPAIIKTDLFRPYYVIPKMSNRRLIAQSGRFIIWGLNRKTGPDYARDIRSTRVRISASAKPDIRKELSRLGIDDSTMFPEIDRASKAIALSFAKT